MRSKPSASQDAHLTFTRQRFRLPSAKAEYPNLPNNWTTTREKGNDVNWWRNSRLWWRRRSWFGHRRPLTRWKAIYHVWSGHYHWGASWVCRSWTPYQRHCRTLEYHCGFIISWTRWPWRPRFTRLHFLWVQACSKNNFGNDSFTHERSFGLDESATFATNSVEAANHHAASTVMAKTGGMNVRTILPPSEHLASSRTGTLTLVECTLFPYIHLLHAHFSVAQFVCTHPHIFMRVHIHAWLKSFQ